MFNKPSSNNKVKFQDQQLDDYLLENSVLKSKLQSKIDALSIMSKELDKCSMERDRYKLLVEQLKCKKIVALNNHENNSNVYRFTPTNTISGGDMLAKTQEHNNLLKLEVEMLRSKLDEATGDIEALRKQLQKNDPISDDNFGIKNSTSPCSNIEYEQLVQELEKFQKKYQQLKLDYQATLDEKEELVSDRDYYKSKVQRLNQQISYILCKRLRPQKDSDGDPPKPVVDINALLTENKYLQERITQLQDEKEIVKRTLTKYKTLLDNKNDNYSHLKKGNNVMTQKQAREFLERIMKSGMRQNSADELKSLCFGLFEAMNDKSIALQHQRKTNRILANRITELEKASENWCNGQKDMPLFPMLLDELFPDVSLMKPEDLESILKDKISNASLDSKDPNKEQFSGSDGDTKVIDSCADLIKQYESDKLIGSEYKSMTKTELPEELQELVKEALAELKITDSLST